MEEGERTKGFPKDNELDVVIISWIPTFPSGNFTSSFLPTTSEFSSTVLPVMKHLLPFSQLPTHLQVIDPVFQKSLEPPREIDPLDPVTYPS